MPAATRCARRGSPARTPSLALLPYDADNLVLSADLDVVRGDKAAARAALQEAPRFAPRHAGARARLGSP